MMKSAYQIEKAMKVLDTISKNINIKIIVDINGKYIGKLITKYTKSSANTILFLGNFVGYESCSGYGYNMENHNFKNIIEKNKEEIANVGVEIKIFTEINDFNKFVENNGYKVIFAI